MGMPHSHCGYTAILHRLGLEYLHLGNALLAVLPGSEYSQYQDTKTFVIAVSCHSLIASCLLTATYKLQQIPSYGAMGEMNYGVNAAPS